MKHETKICLQILIKKASEDTKLSIQVNFKTVAHLATLASFITFHY